MTWQPRVLTAKQLEERRVAAARLLARGRLSQAQIAKRLSVSPSTVCEWANRFERQGNEGLKARHRTGRPSKLTGTQWQQVKRLVERGACAAGFPTERWTLKRVERLIEHEFGVHFHPNYLAEPLHRLGLSVQRPKPQAKERDDALVGAWLKRDWPRIKRGLQSEGLSLSSWTKRVVRFGPPSPRPGRP